MQTLLKIALSATAMLVVSGDCCLADEIKVQSVLLRLIEHVDVPAQEAGVLTTISVRDGDTVVPGDLLAQIEDTNTKLQKERAELDVSIAKLASTTQTDVLEATEELAVAKDDYERGKESRDTFSKAITDAALSQLRLAEVRANAKLSRAKHELEVAALTLQLKQKDLAFMQNALDRRQIRTPITGVVVEVLKHEGEWVEPGEKIARVVRLDQLRAEGFIDARFALRSLVGRPVHVQLNGDTDKTYSGEVVFVSPEIDPVNQQTRIWARINNIEQTLRPGLRAQMVISGDQSSVSAETSKRSRLR